MQLENKYIVPIRFTVFLSLAGAIIVVGVCGCKEAKDYYNRGVTRF